MSLDVTPGRKLPEWRKAIAIGILVGSLIGFGFGLKGPRPVIFSKPQGWELQPDLFWELRHYRFMNNPVNILIIFGSEPCGIRRRVWDLLIRVIRPQSGRRSWVDHSPQRKFLEQSLKRFSENEFESESSGSSRWGSRRPGATCLSFRFSLPPSKF